MKWWQRTLGTGRALNTDSYQQGSLAFNDQCALRTHTSDLSQITFLEKSHEQPSKQTTHHTPTQNVFIIINLLFLCKAWTLLHTKHFCMFTTPVTHLRGGWWLYITAFTSGRSSKQSTTCSFPWAVLILRTGAWVTIVQSRQHLFSVLNRYRMSLPSGSTSLLAPSAA